ncbi:MAG: DUF998 domain-containing protein [Balneolaceae bacterium]|nr:DUF998 domain-containing protein [Balneolaceae bacterium]
MPFFSVDFYFIVKNTTSHLGVQYSPHAWIMNITFAALGLGSIASGWNYYKRYWLHRMLLLLFGTALVLAAIYRHAPIETGITNYYVRHDELYSLFATIDRFYLYIFGSVFYFYTKEHHRPTDSLWDRRVRHSSFYSYVRDFGLYGNMAAYHLYLFVRMDGLCIQR